jgi:hypothetical protein
VQRWEVEVPAGPLAAAPQDGGRGEMDCGSAIQNEATPPRLENIRQARSYGVRELPAYILIHHTPAH